MTGRAWIYFGAVCLMWGVPYFFIKVALHDMSPLEVAWARVTIGALVLLPVALLQGGLRGIRFWPLLALCLAEFLIPLTLIATAEQHITSSLTGILIATEPMLVVILALPFDRSERVDLCRLGGMALGLGGVVVLLGLGIHGANQLGGAALVLVSTASYALGALLIKWHFSEISSIGTVAAGLGLTALLLAVPALLARPHQLPGAPSLGALLILGVPCTAIGFIAFFTLIRLAGVARATVITYVSPTVAVALGVAAGGEPFTVTTGAGLLLILTGSWLATRRASAPHPIPDMTG